MARGDRTRTGKVPVAMPEERRAAAWLRNFRMSGFALSMLLLLVAALVVLAPGLKTLIEQRQQIARLEQSVREAREAVDDLEAQYDRWSDPAYVEAQARDRLYYVHPGDITFLVIGDDEVAPPPDDQPISDEIQTTEIDWVEALVTTVYHAGLTQATPEQLESPVQG